MMNIFVKIALVSVLASLFVSTTLAVGPKKLLGEMSENAGSRPGLLKKAFVSKGRAALGTCTIATKVDTTLTCTKNGTTYTILTDDKTQFRRRFWGKSSLDELQNGDIINVIGIWTDDAHTIVQAKLIRDTSLQMRFGVFFGNVTGLTADGWVMSTIKRGNQTVTVDSDTKIVNRREETITKTDIAVGHRVRVKGLWNSTANTITEVTHVKDFSIPTPPATVTVTPTP